MSLTAVGRSIDVGLAADPASCMSTSTALAALAETCERAALVLGRHAQLDEAAFDRTGSRSASSPEAARWSRRGSWASARRRRRRLHRAAEHVPAQAREDDADRTDLRGADPERRPEPTGPVLVTPSEDTGISLEAGADQVGPMGRIDLTGTYPTGEGAVLQVQRATGPATPGSTSR